MLTPEDAAKARGTTLDAQDIIDQRPPVVNPQSMHASDIGNNRDTARSSAAPDRSPDRSTSHSISESRSTTTDPANLSRPKLSIRGSKASETGPPSFLEELKLKAKKKPYAPAPSSDDSPTRPLPVAMPSMLEELKTKAQRIDAGRN